MESTGKVLSGQQGKALNIAPDQLNPNEKYVLDALRDDGGKMEISSIVNALGWDIPQVPFSLNYSKVKGNSRVRNALRRLVREGLVMHNTQIGDGTYMASDIGPVLANPQPVDIDRVTMRAMVEGRKSDCAMYNACLDQAISGNWAGFSCTSCKAYCQPDEFQKEQNILGLRAVQVAADLVAKHGKVNRIRGVKPGADAKRTYADTVSLSEALAAAD